MICFYFSQGASTSKNAGKSTPAVVGKGKNVAADKGKFAIAGKSNPAVVGKEQATSAGDGRIPIAVGRGKAPSAGDGRSAVAGRGKSTASTARECRSEAASGPELPSFAHKMTVGKLLEYLMKTNQIGGMGKMLCKKHKRS